MVVGIGIDVVETERLAHALSSQVEGSFEQRVFTAGELATCASRCDRIQALAARFAAKEACLKAMGAGILDGDLRQVEVVPGQNGAPRLRLTGALAQRARLRGVRTAHVSLTHQPGIAAAFVVLEGATPRRPR
jgi:holo-[acyl-carrier protein] synthase